MPRKKSLRRSAQYFDERAQDLLDYVDSCTALSDEHISWCHEYAVIRLYREFEYLMQEAITAAINNDTQTISNTVGITFPAHLTDELCEYLITSGGYFDFKGRDGLIKTIRKFLPENHYLVEIVKKRRYKEALDQLSSLRNYAAHDSIQAKNAVKKAVDQERVGSCGSWLKKQGRLFSLVTRLRDLAQEVQDNAPY